MKVLLGDKPRQSDLGHSGEDSGVYRAPSSSSDCPSNLDGAPLLADGPRGQECCSGEWAELLRERVCVWLLTAQKSINRSGWWKTKFALFQMSATGGAQRGADICPKTDSPHRQQSRG